MLGSPFGACHYAVGAGGFPAEGGYFFELPLLQRLVQGERSASLGLSGGRGYESET